MGSRARANTGSNCASGQYSVGVREGMEPLADPQLLPHQSDLHGVRKRNLVKTILNFN